MFSIADIRAAHGDFDRRRLSEWQKKRCAQLDFSRLAKDLEPFVYSKKKVNRILMFLDFVQQEV